MNRTIKLTLEDRFNLGRYSRKLPCTLALRLSINDFLSQIEITSEELETYEVNIDKATMQFTCNNSDYVVEYDAFPDSITTSMARYVALLNHEKNIENVMVQKTIEAFKKII